MAGPATWPNALREAWSAPRALVFVAMVVAFALQVPLWDWWVEDAAITFGYSRNLANGAGLVAFPGDERVEGFSNPTWTLLLALVYWLGGGPFTWSNYLGAVASSLAVGLTGLVGERLQPDGKSWRWMGALTAWIMAVNAQLAIWGSSGLENGLFSLFLALGMLGLTQEDEGRSTAWAPLGFLLLALTRPEGPVYAGAAAMCATGFALAHPDRVARLKALAAWWVGVALVPFCAAHAVRYAYFSFPFPATYYAKLGSYEFAFEAWEERQWTYLRDYAAQLFQGYMLPVYVLAVAGTREGKGFAGLALSLVLALVLLWEPAESLSFVGFPDLPMSENFLWFRPSALVSALGAAVVLAGLHPQRRVVLPAALFAAIGLAFTVRSNGDWMRGFRWLSLIAGPASVLLALGLAEAAQLLMRVAAPAWKRAPWVATWAGAALCCEPQLEYWWWYQDRTETSPSAIRRRTEFFKRLGRTVLHDEPFAVLDHDMGAMLWWGRDELRVRDTRGLTDLGFALHPKRRAYMNDMLLRPDQTPPEAVHAKGRTLTATASLSPFRRDYVRVPGYTSREAQKSADSIRRELLIGEPDPDLGWPLLTGFDLAHLAVLTPAVVSDGRLLVELGLSQVVRKNEGANLIVFLARDGEVVDQRVVTPGQGWLEPSRWRKQEVVLSRLHWKLPELEPGSYDLGIFAYDDQGRAATSTTLPMQKRELVGRGELVFPGMVAVVEPAVLEEAEESGLRAAQALAAAGECEAAWERRRTVWLGRIWDPSWVKLHDHPVREQVAACMVRSATDLPDFEAVRVIEHARLRAATASEPYVAGRALGRRLQARGEELYRAGEFEEAYRWLAGAVRADPTRSKARRWAESARAARIEGEPTPVVP